MTETEWTEEGEAPVKKKRVPTWVWIGCGGGCLLAIIVGALLTFATMRMIEEASDPEIAWEKLTTDLAYDVRPDGWDARGTRKFGIGMFILDPPSDEFVIVQSFADQASLDQQFDPEAFGQSWVMNDPEAGTITVQGRETRCLRFLAKGGDPEEGGSGPSIRVDLTGSGNRYVYVQITSPSNEGRIEDELVEQLLQPFDAWRGK